MSNWNPPEKCQSVNYVRAFTNTFRTRETIDPQVLPNLKTATSVILASDYSGEHDQSRYYVLGYLLGSEDSLFNDWEPERLKIRREYLGPNRTMDFKGLTDNMKQRALLPFLKAADLIDGLLVCVAFDKSVEHISDTIQIPGNLHEAWKPKVWEKMIRILLFGSIFTGGLCQSAKSLKWITDDDEIVCNNPRKVDTSQVMTQMLGHFGPDNLKTVDPFIASHIGGESQGEDLTAIPDLVAGTVSAHLNGFDPADIPSSSSLYIPNQRRTPTKVELIHAWMSFPTRLKKLVCLVRQHAPGQLLISVANVECSTFAPNRISLPLDKGWQDSSKHWRLFE